ncbi:murein hydrolase activator EnvC family protein [Alkalibacillus silvisoli]|uniref:M23 family metallopeptidase n=1 Tax=Alkalibacillus silvisoli TaxID=392823 RepID=A0ABP3JS78_9BACI
MAKKVIPFLTLTLVIGVIMFTDSNTVEANQSVEDIEKELDEVQEERESVSQEIESLKDELSELESQQEETEDELSRIDNEIEQAELEVRQKELDIEHTETEIRKLESEIQELENEINDLIEEIEALEEEIVETEERVEQREGVLKDRLRSLQRNGGSVKYMEVIMGASDFGDFISRSAAVNKVMDQDQNIIHQHFEDIQFLEESVSKVEESKDQVEENKQIVENNKGELEGKQQSLVTQKQELDSLIASLGERKDEQQVMLASLNEQQDDLEKYQVSLAEEQEILAAREQSLQNQKEAAETQPSATQSGGSGKFITPMQGYLTSPYKPSHRPNHNGIDMGGNGSPPIYAAATGEVYRVTSGCTVGNTGCGGGYGNVVYMTHYIDGVPYDTVYAHLSSVNVSVGDVVQQGQQIGNMGNTGHSYGPHLHFEIHRGGPWNDEKSNAVDPKQYISVPSR